MNVFKFISKRRKEAKARRIQLPPQQPLKRGASDQTASQSAHGFSVGNRSQELNLADTESPLNAVEVVEAWVEALNRHASLKELLQYAASEDVRVKFDDTPSVLFVEMMQEMRNISRSFPDFCVSHASITQLVEGVVVVEGFGARGTHGGMPYGFGPFPRIPTTHQHVVAGESRLMMTVGSNGKISKIKVVSEGLTGPRAMYAGIGGSLELPRENPVVESELWLAISH